MARYAENAVFRIEGKTFDEIDDWIRAAKAVGRNYRYGMNALAMLMAYTNYQIAREMSAGPIDRGERHPEWAWKIPVRRIQMDYFNGWKVRRLAPGLWALINDSREAWFIEFGIHPSGTRVEGRGGKVYLKGSRRVRRPIRKLSLKRTLRFVDQSRAGDLVWEKIHAPFRAGMHNERRGDLMMNDMVQSVPGMRFL